MKRKYEEIEQDSKRVKIEVNRKRKREELYDNNGSAEDDEEEVLEVLKKGVIRKVKYNFIKIDVTKVPTYIL
jgi:hypothetical protein